MEKKFEVTTAAITPCSTEDSKTFCPMSRIPPVTARAELQ